MINFFLKYANKIKGEIIMGYDICISNDTTVKELNWLRNAFGLIQWAEDNVGNFINIAKFTEIPKNERPLYYVCNHWSYNTANQIDRALFKRVVLEYNQFVQLMSQGYFYFNSIEQLHTYWNEFVSWNKIWNKKNIQSLDTALYFPNTLGYNIQIPIAVFYSDDDINDHYIHNLDEYKQWFKELVELAELMQDPSTNVYITN